MKIRYFGPFSLDTGYSRACSDYLMALRKAGADLDIRPILDGDERILEDRYKELLPLANREDVAYPDWPDVIISHATPVGCSVFVEKELAPPPGIKRVAITTYETEKMPKALVRDLVDHFDQIWVPSDYCKQSFKPHFPYDDFDTEDHIEGMVRIVPHTFDPNYWFTKEHYRKASNSFDQDNPNDYERPYVFYTILTWCERKNPMGLLKAYLTEFGPDDDVLLKIRTPGFNTGEVEELARGLKLDYLPPVDMICDYLTETQMLDLHLSSDCYVTTARAEGWGLGAFEAALVGNPVIATGYSGLMEFLDDYVSCSLLDVFKTPAYTPESVSNSVLNVAGLTIKPKLRNDHNGIAGDQLWAEPNLEQAKFFMRRSYEGNHGPERDSQKYLAENFSYEAVGKIMMKNLRDLLG